MATSTASLLSRMHDMGTEEVDHTALIELYGPQGTGKTTLAMWLAQSLNPENGRILYIDSAAGWVSLEATPSLMENTTRLSFNGYADLPAVAELISKGTVAGGVNFGATTVVVLDEIDSMSDDALVQLVREKHGTPANQQLPEIEGKDYRPMGDLMILAITAFQKAGVHLILVAHDKIRKDHRNVEVTGPSVTPALQTKISNLMHVVAHTTAEIKGTAAKPEYVRQVQSLPTLLVQAKTRISGLRRQVKLSHDDFVETVSDWVYSDTMAEDLSQPEVETEIAPDELPTEGLPVADVADEDDDAPAFVGSTD